MYGCHEKRLSLSLKIQNGCLRFFFILCMMKGDINTNQMVKTPSRLMHWIPLFGVDDVIFLPQNWYFVNFLENGAYDFFILGIRIEDINTYQMAKTASKLIHFFRSYSPRTGLMTSSFGPKFNRIKTRWTKVAILLYFDEKFYHQGRSGKCEGFAFVTSRTISTLRKSEPQWFKGYLIFQMMFWIDHAEWIFSKHFRDLMTSY